MALTAKNIREMAQAGLPDTDLFIVDVSVSDSPARPKITVLADGEQGITIDQCATISRRINKQIEEQFGPDMSYVLEVSSPGVDFPLTQPQQFKRHTGRSLKVKLQDGTEKTGKLEEVTETGLNLMEEVKQKGKKATYVPVQIPFGDIVKANVVISFK
ncbi:ribosome maturation factor RimP [Pontibacter anaerobius]|uniref:Ribosome maturation factor RimP n=1 Tax=Pontibacter anaerobius TaxID=2993940 RepID=A0ABT3RKK2_9BACT|nr:ribosome maturation factor RimP [Pontibacter anaerobius]MCX2742137.1 ribosome maturation factor RimP [Pontibacter anaerobius]